MSTPSQPSSDYASRKAYFDNLLTIYGRKPVLEALRDPSLEIVTVHLAQSNRPAAILDQISEQAQQRGINVNYIDKQALSRISRNARQDQGVAADINLPRYQPLQDWLRNWQPKPGARLLALDGVTNPQNLGMVIRSVAAAGIDALLLPRRGNAQLGPLAIKASAGTAFRCPIVHCDTLPAALREIAASGARIAVLSGDAKTELFNDRQNNPPATVYVLGNESEGVSAEVATLADTRLRIAMENDVESLNVAVTAALVAFAR